MVRFISSTIRLLLLTTFQLGCNSVILVYEPPPRSDGSKWDPVTVEVPSSSFASVVVVTGFVFDLHTLQPVELAYVYLNTNQVEFSMTDEEGRFTFAVPGDASTLDPFQITVSKSGYESSINTYSKIRIGSIYLKRKSDGKRMGPAFN